VSVTKSLMQSLEDIPPPTQTYALMHRHITPDLMLNLINLGGSGGLFKCFLCS
jgi:hypothetical protein